MISISIDFHGIIERMNKLRFAVTVFLPSSARKCHRLIRRHYRWAPSAWKGLRHRLSSRTMFEWCWEIGSNRSKIPGHFDFHLLSFAMNIEIVCRMLDVASTLKCTATPVSLGKERILRQHWLKSIARTSSQWQFLDPMAICKIEAKLNEIFSNINNNVTVNLHKVIREKCNVLVKVSVHIKAKENRCCTGANHVHKVTWHNEFEVKAPDDFGFSICGF